MYSKSVVVVIGLLPSLAQWVKRLWLMHNIARFFSFIFRMINFLFKISSLFRLLLHYILYITYTLHQLFFSPRCKAFKWRRLIITGIYCFADTSYLISELFNLSIRCVLTEWVVFFIICLSLFLIIIILGIDYIVWVWEEKECYLPSFLYTTEKQDVASINEGVLKPKEEKKAHPVLLPIGYSIFLHVLQTKFFDIGEKSTRKKKNIFVFSYYIEHRPWQNRRWKRCVSGFFL